MRNNFRKGKIKNLSIEKGIPKIWEQSVDEAKKSMQKNFLNFSENKGKKKPNFNENLCSELDEFLLYHSYGCKYEHLNRLFLENGPLILFKEYKKFNSDFREEASESNPVYLQIKKTLQNYKQMISQILENFTPAHVLQVLILLTITV